MLVDSHCHLNLIDLAPFNNNMEEVLSQAEANEVEHFLCVCVELSDYPVLEQLAALYPKVSISVGLHPNNEGEVSAEELVSLAKNSACIAIGETGLDYYRTTTAQEQDRQRLRFREHIKAALISKKPLIIHTRQAAKDTLRVLEEEGAERIGGVMHCFSESLEIAKRAIDLNFYISFSGILTFKNALALQEVAKAIPLDRILIETDSPYLAPIPYRGQQNHPALVKYIAETIARLRGLPYEEVALKTTHNFYECFLKTKRPR